MNTRVDQEIEELEGVAFAKEVARYLLEKKGKNVMLLDLKGSSNFADYFVICSGTSDRHVKALSESVHLGMKKEYGIMPHHVEGQSNSQWILLDYGSIIVHIFFDYLREYYALENLWKESTLVPIPALDESTSPAL